MFLAISIASFNLFNLVSTLSVIFLIKIFILKIRRVLLADIVLSQIRINRQGEKARQVYRECIQNRVYAIQCRHILETIFGFLSLGWFHLLFRTMWREMGPYSRAAANKRPHNLQSYCGVSV